MSDPKNLADSYSNLVTQMGTSRDKSSYSRFLPNPDIPAAELDAMYEQDAMSARIVDRLPDDATREEVFLTGTDERVDFASVQSQLEDLDAVGRLSEAWKWARLYGGALVLMVVNDGKTMDMPLDLADATKLASLQVLEKPFLTPDGFNAGMGARAFRNPEHYTMLVPFGSSKVRKIHRTRVIRFDGVQVPNTRLVQRGGWGPSVLDRVHVELTQLGDVMGYSRHIMHNISLMVFKLEGFRAMLCGGPQQKAQAAEIIESLVTNADTLHATGLDTSDELVEVSRSVSGVTDLMDQFIAALVRASGMPRVVLLGEQPGGQNASADSEIRTWFDFVASQQRLVLTPALNRLLTVIFRIRGNDGEVVPDEWTVNYSPLWQPTELEKADTLLKRSQAASLLLDQGVLQVEQVEADLVSAGLITETEAPADDGET
jgi:phage-related protein (TIGR01555 family)